MQGPFSNSLFLDSVGAEDAQTPTQQKAARLAERAANKQTKLGVNTNSAEYLQQSLSDMVDQQVYQRDDGSYYQYDYVPTLDNTGNLTTYAQERDFDPGLNTYGTDNLRNLYIDDTAQGNYKLGLAASDVNPEFISPWTGKPITPYEARYLDKQGVKGVYLGGGRAYNGTPGPMGVTPQDGALMDITLPGDMATQFEYDVHSNVGQLANRAIGQGLVTQEDILNYGSGKTEYTTPDAPMWNVGATIPTQLDPKTPLPRDPYDKHAPQLNLDGTIAVAPEVGGVQPADTDGYLGNLVDGVQGALGSAGAKAVDTVADFAIRAAKEIAEKGLDITEDQSNVRLKNMAKKYGFDNLVNNKGNFIGMDKYKELSEYGYDDSRIQEYSAEFKKVMSDDKAGFLDKLWVAAKGIQHFPEVLATSTGEMALAALPVGWAVLASTSANEFLEERVKTKGTSDLTAEDYAIAGSMGLVYAGVNQFTKGMAGLKPTSEVVNKIVGGLSTEGGRAIIATLAGKLANGAFKGFEEGVEEVIQGAAEVVGQKYGTSKEDEILTKDTALDLGLQATLGAGAGIGSAITKDVVTGVKPALGVIADAGDKAINGKKNKAKEAEVKRFNAAIADIDKVLKPEMKVTKDEATGEVTEEPIIQHSKEVTELGNKIARGDDLSPEDLQYQSDNKEAVEAYLKDKANLATNLKGMYDTILNMEKEHTDEIFTKEIKSRKDAIIAKMEEEGIPIPQPSNPVYDTEAEITKEEAGVYVDKLKDLSRRAAVPDAILGDEDYATLTELEAFADKYKGPQATQDAIAVNIADIKKKLAAQLEDSDVEEEARVFGSSSTSKEVRANLAEAYIEDVLDGNGDKEVTPKLTNKLLAIAKANGVSDSVLAKYMTPSKDAFIVNEQATIGPRGMNTYKKALGNLLNNPKPDDKQVNTLLNNIQKFAASQHNYAKVLGDALADIETKLSTYNVNKDSGLLKQPEGATKFNAENGTAQYEVVIPQAKSNSTWTVNVKVDGNGKWKIDQSSYAHVDLKTDNARKTIDIIGKYSKTLKDLGIDTSAYGVGGSGVKVKTGSKALKIHTSDNAFYERNNVNKVITPIDATNNKWSREAYADMNIGSINTGDYTADDTVLLSFPYVGEYTKTADGKKVKNTEKYNKHLTDLKNYFLSGPASAEIKKAVAAGATIVLDYSTGVPTKDMKVIAQQLVSLKKYATVNKEDGSKSLVFMPKDKATKINEKIKADVEAKKEEAATKKETEESLALELLNGKEVVSKSKEFIDKYYNGDADKFTNMLTKINKEAVEAIKAIRARLASDEDIFDKTEDTTLLETYDKAYIKEADKQIAEQADIDKKVVDVVAEYRRLEEAGDEVAMEIFVAKITEDPEIERIMTNSSSAGKTKMFVYTRFDKETQKNKMTYSHKKATAMESKVEGTEVSTQELDINKIVSISNNTFLNSVSPNVMGSKIKNITAAFAGNLKKALGSKSKINPHADKDDSSAVTSEKFKLNAILLDDPARGLIFSVDSFNGNEFINETTALAMTLSIKEFVSVNSRMLDNGFKSAGDVGNMFGIPEFDVSRELLKLVKDKGMLRRSLANSLGKAILKKLGLKRIKDIDSETFDKLVASVGNSAIEAEIAAGKLEPLKVSVGKLGSALGKDTSSIINEDAEVQFVRFTDKQVAGKSSKETYIKDSKDDFLEISEHIADESVFRKEYKLKAVKNSPHANKVAKTSAGFKTSSKAEKMMEELRTTKWKVNHRLIKKMLQKDRRDVLLKWLGYTEDTSSMSFYDADGQISKNRDILKSIEELELIVAKFDASEGKTAGDIYFDWFYSSNGRYMMDSNTINPQTDKLHRFLVQPAELEQELTVKDNRIINEDGVDITNEFDYALMQGLGMDVDKETAETITSYATAIREKPELYKEIAEAFDKGEEYTLSINGLEDLGLEPDHISHAYQALEALEGITKGKFTTSLTAETDAVTSGFALKLLQMPILGDIFKWLNKVGIFRSKDLSDMDLESQNLSVTMNDILNSKVKGQPFLDSYQTLASDMKVTVDEVEAGIEKLRKNDSRLAIFDKNRWAVISEVLPKTDINGKVTKKLRTLFKDPFMTFNYSAGIKSIRQSLTANISNDLVTMMINAKEGTAEFNLLADTANQFGFDSTDKFKEELRTKALYAIVKEDKNGKYKGNLENYLASYIDGSYGAKVEEIMTTNFKPFMEGHEKINQAFKAMFHLFNNEYNKKVQEKLAKNNKITDQDKLDIINELRHKFPAIKGPLSDSANNEDYIGIYSTKNAVPGSGISRHAATQTITSSEEEDKRTNKVSHEIKQFEAAISAGSVVPIHYIDGAIMGKLITELEGNFTPIHDAVMVKLGKIASAAKLYNKETMEVGRNYSFVAEIANQLDTAFEGVDPTELPELQLSGNKTISIEDVIGNFKGFAKEVVDGRTALFNELDKGYTAVHMASMPEGAYSNVKATGTEYQKASDLTLKADDEFLFNAIKERLSSTFPNITAEKVDKIITENGEEAIGSAIRDMVKFTDEASVDTLPHEYSHIYINLLEDTPFMANALNNIKESKKVSILEAKEILADAMGKEYVDIFTSNTPTRARRVWKAIINMFKKLFKPSERAQITFEAHVVEAASRLFTGTNADAISLTPKKGTSKVDPTFDFDNQPYPAGIIKDIMRLGEGRAILTGSEALAMQGDIYRKQGKNGTDLHDVDMAIQEVDRTKIVKGLEKDYNLTNIYSFRIPTGKFAKGAEKILRQVPMLKVLAPVVVPLSKVLSGSKIDSYIVTPKGTTVVDITRYKGKHSRVTGYRLVDSKGNEVGTYSAEVKEAGTRTEIVSETSTGEKAVILDLIEDHVGRETFTWDHDGTDIIVSGAEDTFLGKWDLGKDVARDKDIRDANSFYNKDFRDPKLPPEDGDSIPLFSQIDIGDGKHITYDFNPKSYTNEGPKLPGSIGAKASVEVIGHYKDGDMEYRTVKVTIDGKTYTEQPSGTPLHITDYVNKSNDIKPFMTGKHAKENPELVNRASGTLTGKISVATGKYLSKYDRTHPDNAKGLGANKGLTSLVLSDKKSFEGQPYTVLDASGKEIGEVVLNADSTLEDFLASSDIEADETGLDTSTLSNNVVAIASLFINEDSRNKGYAKDVLKTILNDYQDRTLVLDAYPTDDNIDIDALQDMYTKAGFSLLERDNFDDDGVVIMTREPKKVSAGDELNEVYVTDKELKDLKAYNKAFIDKYPGMIEEGIEFMFYPDTNKIEVVKPDINNSVDEAMYEVYLNHEIKHALTYKWLNDNANKDSVTYLRNALRKAANDLDPGQDLYKNLLKDRLDYANKQGNDINSVAELVAILSSEPNIRKSFMEVFPQAQQTKLAKILDAVKEFLGLGTERVIETVDAIVAAGKVDTTTPAKSLGATWLGDQYKGADAAYWKSRRKGKAVKDKAVKAPQNESGLVSEINANKPRHIRKGKDVAVTIKGFNKDGKALVVYPNGTVAYPQPINEIKLGQKAIEELISKYSALGANSTPGISAQELAALKTLYAANTSTKDSGTIAPIISNKARVAARDIIRKAAENCKGK